MSGHRDATYPETVEEQTHKVEYHVQGVVLHVLRDDARGDDRTRCKDEAAGDRRAQAVLGHPYASTIFAPCDEHAV